MYSKPKQLSDMTLTELIRHRDRFIDQIAKVEADNARGVIDRQHEVDLEIRIEAKRQARWLAKTKGQQAEYLLFQLNKTMGLYSSAEYRKLSRKGLDWLRDNGHLSTPLARDLNDEIPF